MTPDAISRMVSGGWVFEYTPSTRYIGARHKQGGQQSIAEIKARSDGDVFGFTIASALNGAPPNPNREATQEFEINKILCRHCGRCLTLDAVDLIAAELVEATRSGPCSWAFKP